MKPSSPEEVNELPAPRGATVFRADKLPSSGSLFTDRELQALSRAGKNQRASWMARRRRFYALKHP